MIYFVRHGETDYNKISKFQGHLDIPLNETGINQAKQALENSKSIKINTIFCSPLSRAVETAKIINKYHNAKLIFDDRLKELYMGTLQDRIKNDLTKQEQNLAFTSPEYFGGESIQEFCMRVHSFFKEIENSKENILIVSHGGVYRAIYKYINNIDNFDFELKTIPNATIILIKE